MSQHLIRQIDTLKQKILYEGTCVEDAIAQAVQSLINRDRVLASEVIQHDDEIDRLEVEIEEECLKTLALYQPVAADLRFVVAILKINNDLERIGDLATNIAKRAISLADADYADMVPDIRTMANKAQSMVKASLDALVSQDSRLARRVREDDDIVDNMRRDIQTKVKEHLRQFPQDFENWSKISSASRHIERVADMATNIAEEVVYMAEGAIVRHHPQE
jgi:phosphate transport system protein